MKTYTHATAFGENHEHVTDICLNKPFEYKNLEDLNKNC